MDASFDTAKIASGSRPFFYKPPPFSIQAAHWIGVAFIALAAFLSIAAALSAYHFGVTQFLFVTGIAFGALIVGTLICGMAQSWKASFDVLQIVAYKGKY